jgi:hypothetical protein
VKSHSHGPALGIQKYTIENITCDANTKGTQDIAKFLTITAPEIVADYTGFLPGVGVLRTAPENVFKMLFNPRSLGHPDGMQL